MKKTSREFSELPQLVKSSLALFSFIGVFLFAGSTWREPEPWKQSIRDLFTLIKTQEDTDRRLQNEMKSGIYTFENPLIILDPYDASPLSALWLFQSNDPLKCSVKVVGKDESSTFVYAFPDFRTEHWIPIYGLYPNAVTSVIIEAERANGEAMKIDRQIKTEPLPVMHMDAFMTIRMKDVSNLQPGVNYCSFSDSILVFDLNGDIRWVHSLGLSYVALFGNENHRNVFTVGCTNYGDALVFSASLLGRIHSVYYTPYGVHHEIQEGKNGNFLVAGSKNRNTVEDFIYEINTSAGTIDNAIDLTLVFPKDRNAQNDNARDWFHLNTIVWLPEEEAILVSGRNQSVVAKLYWPSGIPQWILADYENWPSSYVPYLLKPFGQRFEWPYTQHAPKILADADKNPDTFDVLIFDNGNYRPQYEHNPAYFYGKETSNRYSRIACYRVNEKDMTIKLLWQYGSSRSELFSPIRGDAHLLGNGNVLGIFDLGKQDNRSIIVEIDPKTQTSVYEAEINRDGYRVERRELFSNLDFELDIGTPVRNFIPKEIEEKYAPL
jgi:arylsulfate sulfotransferase